jgi:hypothetical protein
MTPNGSDPRWHALQIAAVLLLTVSGLVAPVAATPAPSNYGTAADSAGVIVASSSPGNNSTSGNQTTTTPGSSTGGGPSMASQVRINPLHFEEAFLNVSVKTPEEAYATSGPFAIFSLSEPVAGARITQSPASASVLAGGRQVRVDYEPDAAPVGEASLYELELFFADESNLTVDLYARTTGVSVGATQLEQYRPLIESLKDGATAKGYETTPAALTDYYSYLKNRAELVDGFLSQQAAKLFALAFAAVRLWLFWLIAILLVMLVGYWIQAKYGGILEALENDPGEYSRRRDELQRHYREARQTADEVSLAEVDEIGANHIYWEDAYGVTSLAQLAALAARGMDEPTRDGGLERAHNGVADLTAENIHDSWLEPVLRDQRIPTARQALSHLKRACERMETRHEPREFYRDTRDELAALIDDLDDRQTQTAGHGLGGDD